MYDWFITPKFHRKKDKDQHIAFLCLIDNRKGTLTIKRWFSGHILNLATWTCLSSNLEWNSGLHLLKPSTQTCLFACGTSLLLRYKWRGCTLYLWYVVSNLWQLHHTSYQISDNYIVSNLLCHCIKSFTYNYIIS